MGMSSKSANVDYLVSRIKAGKLVNDEYEFMVHDVNGELNTKLVFNIKLGEIRKFNSNGKEITAKSVKCKAGGNSYPTITFYRDLPCNWLDYSQNSIHNDKSIEMNISVHIIACIIKVQLSGGVYGRESVANHMNGNHKDCSLCNLEECSTEWNNIHGNVLSIIYRHYLNNKCYSNIVSEYTDCSGKENCCLNFHLSVNDIRKFISIFPETGEAILHYKKKSNACRVDMAVSCFINWLTKNKLAA